MSSATSSGLTFTSVGFAEGVVGDLDPKTVTVEGQPYTINGLQYLVTTNSAMEVISNVFVLRFTSELPEGVLPGLELHVEGLSDPIALFGGGNAAGEFSLSVANPGLDWSTGDRIQVRITRTVRHIDPSIDVQLQQGTVHGNKLVLRYRNYLRPTRSGAGAPLPEAYTVMVDGNRVHVTSTRINTRFVTLMLARAVSHRAANVTVSYDNRLPNAVQESSYHIVFIPSFTNYSVRNITQPSATTPGTGGG